MNDIPVVAQPSPDNGRIIKFVLRLILTSLLSMLLLTLATAGVTAYLLPKEYFSKVTMEVKSDSNGSMTGSGTTARSYDPQFMATQFQKMQTQEILYPVIDRLDLTKEYAPPGKKLSQQEAYLRLKRSMKFTEVRTTGLIEIGVYDTDPQRAANTANNIAVIYKERRQEALEGVTNSSLEKLGDEMEKQRKATEDAAALVTQIRERYGITDSDPEKENSNIGFREAAATAIDAQADAPEASAIEKAKLKEYSEAKSKHIQSRKLLDKEELKYNSDKMGSSGPPSAIIWEKAEKSGEPARPNVALCTLVAAPVGLILGAGLFLIRNFRTRLN